MKLRGRCRRRQAALVVVGAGILAADAKGGGGLCDGRRGCPAADAAAAHCRRSGAGVKKMAETGVLRALCVNPGAKAGVGCECLWYIAVSVLHTEEKKLTKADFPAVLSKTVVWAVECTRTAVR